MRFAHVISAAIAVFLATSDVTPAATLSGKPKISSRPRHQGSEMLRRTPAQKSAPLNKATIQKLQFALWKAARKPPQQLFEELGLARLGQAAIGTKDWKTHEADYKFYGKGPKTYP
ncbi:hypothetical protein ON010_g7592 [Phytophthora cinnamomi]|nr:hypothetical protein ON010_g7592 [Phytophthora cinnamomi]